VVVVSVMSGWFLGGGIGMQSFLPLSHYCVGRSGGRGAFSVL